MGTSRSEFFPCCSGSTWISEHQDKNQRQVSNDKVNPTAIFEISTGLQDPWKTHYSKAAQKQETISTQKAEVFTATICHFYTRCIKLQQVFERFCLRNNYGDLQYLDSFISSFLDFSEDLFSPPAEMQDNGMYFLSSFTMQTHYLRSGKKNKQPHNPVTFANFNYRASWEEQHPNPAGFLNRQCDPLLTDCFLYRYARREAIEQILLLIYLGFFHNFYPAHSQRADYCSCQHIWRIASALQ